MNITEAIAGSGGLYALCGVAVWLGLRLTGQVNLGLVGCAALAVPVFGLAPAAALAAGCGIGAVAAGGVELAVMRRAGTGAGSVMAGLAAWLALAGVAGAVARLLRAPVAGA